MEHSQLEYQQNENFLNSMPKQRMRAACHFINSERTSTTSQVNITQPEYKTHTPTQQKKQVHNHGKDNQKNTTQDHESLSCRGQWPTNSSLRNYCWGIRIFDTVEWCSPGKNWICKWFRKPLRRSEFIFLKNKGQCSICVFHQQQWRHYNHNKFLQSSLQEHQLQYWHRRKLIFMIRKMTV